MRLRIRPRRRRNYSTVPAMIEMLEVRRVPSGAPVAAAQPQADPPTEATQAVNNQLNPKTASDGKGDSVAVWANSGQAGSQPGVYAQIYNSGGGASGSAFRVDTDTTGQDVQPSVAMDAAGDFVIAWSNASQNGEQSVVLAREFSLNGTALGDEFRVDPGGSTNQQSPVVAMDSAGDFVVEWTSPTTDGGYGIFAQRFNSAGVSQGSALEIDNSSNQNRITPTVEIDPNGNLTSTHQTYAEDVSLFGVFAQNGIGYFPGSEFQFNTATTNSAYPGMPIEDEGNWFWT